MVNASTALVRYDPTWRFKNLFILALQVDVDFELYGVAQT